MKNKALQLPAIIIAIGLVLSIVAYFLTGILKVPAITEHDFNYSATYEIDGQTYVERSLSSCQPRSYQIGQEINIICNHNTSP